MACFLSRKESEGYVTKKMWYNHRRNGWTLGNINLKRALDCCLHEIYLKSDLERFAIFEIDEEETMHNMNLFNN